MWSGTWTHSRVGLRRVLDCSSRLSVSSPDRAAGSWNSLRPGLGSGSGLDWGWILRGSGLQQEVQPVINSQFDSSGFSSLCLCFSLCNLLNWSHLRGRTLSSLHLPLSILYTSRFPGGRFFLTSKSTFCIPTRGDQSCLLPRYSGLWAVLCFWSSGAVERKIKGY